VKRESSEVNIKNETAYISIQKKKNSYMIVLAFRHVFLGTRHINYVNAPIAVDQI